VVFADVSADDFAVAADSEAAVVLTRPIATLSEVGPRAA